MAVIPEVIFPQGRAFFVATAAGGGSDSNPGTIIAPFLTITHGMSVLLAGDILFCRGGTYAESLNNVFPQNGTAIAPITISAYQSEVAIVQPSSGVSVVYIGTDRSYITFRNLVLDGINTTVDGVKFTKDSGSTAGPNNCGFIGCEIRNPNQNGFLITEASDTGNCHHNFFKNGLIHGGRDFTNPNHYHGIYCEANDCTFTGNEIHHMQAYGIQIFDGSNGHGSRNTVAFNNLHDNSQDTATHTAGFILGTGTGNTGYNNIVWNNKIGIKTGQGDTNSTIYNNTLYNNSLYGIALADSGTSTSPVCENNIAFGNGTDFADNGPSTTPTVNWNMSGDATFTVALGANNKPSTNPQFVNAAGADFHIQSSSPAKNAGLTIAAVTTDYDGKSRPQSTAYCMGAYEDGP